MESSGRLEIISNNRIRPIERDNNQSSRRLRVEKKTAIFRKSKNREREKERERRNEGVRWMRASEREREKEKRERGVWTARTHARTQRHAHMPLACSGSHKVAPHVVLSLLYISRPTRSRPLVRPCVTTIRETAMT